MQSIYKDKLLRHANHYSMPLYHFVTGNLPENTKAPELDDKNAKAALRSYAEWKNDQVEIDNVIDESLLSKYLRYLVDIDFLPAPTSSTGKALPPSRLKPEQKKFLTQLVGRGALA